MCMRGGSSKKVKSSIFITENGWKMLEKWQHSPCYLETDHGSDVRPFLLE